jgi:hypothetical protein
MNKKLYLFLAIGLILIIAGAYFLLWDVNEVDEPEMTPEEQEFNDSGRAKAVEDETDLWPVYNSEEVGFSVQHPVDVEMLAGASKEGDKTYFAVNLREIGGPEAPGELGYDDQMESIQDLTSGQFGVPQGFSLEESRQVKSVGFLFAQDFMTLGRFEVCDVTLERTLLFYFNNQQISIRLFGPIDTLQSTMPEYFEQDETNCGSELAWDFDKQAEFYESLAAGNGSPEIQAWYDMFDQIAETVIFAHR